jgi:4-hydroxy-3-methylbut-2-enyl diphosphate reductase
LDLEKKGYQPIIFGEPEHPEIIGIAGNLKQPIIIKSVEDISQLPRISKAGIVCQTTQATERFNEIVAALKQHCDELIVHNTICAATTKRQDSAVQLAKQVDLIIVIGGRNSGNTKRLKQLCSNITKTIHIESAAELTPEMFNKTATIGITAGASTPTDVIQDVVEVIENEF